MRVIVCGSRGWSDAGAITSDLAALPAGTTIVHGDARGADRLAEAAARRLGLATEAHPANWARYGKSAGPRRNAEMVALGADLCLAYRLEGPSRGTDDMVGRCRSHGILVRLNAGKALPCAPGQHRGRRQPDGSLRCSMCGATSRPRYAQAQLPLPA